MLKSQMQVFDILNTMSRFQRQSSQLICFYNIKLPYHVLNGTATTNELIQNFMFLYGNQKKPTFFHIGSRIEMITTFVKVMLEYITKTGKV